MIIIVFLFQHGSKTEDTSKRSRTVLRRESGSNPADLAGILFGGFAPNSSSAERLSKALGEQTVLSGSVSRGKNDPSQSLQMIGRPLMTPDELKSLPKGNFIVMKTGTHPMRAELRLFLKWGITYSEPYELPEKAARTVQYADKTEMEKAIVAKYPPPRRPIPPARRRPPAPVKVGDDDADL